VTPVRERDVLALYAKLTLTELRADLAQIGYPTGPVTTGSHNTSSAPQLTGVKLSAGGEPVEPLRGMVACRDSVYERTFRLAWPRAENLQLGRGGLA
jgi:hypothetical protein